MIVDLGGEKIDAEYVPDVQDELYREVFESANWAVMSQPWRTLSERNAFVIIDPESNERVVATLMGGTGEFVAFQLYLQREGLQWIDRMHRSRGEDPELGLLAQFEMRLLEVEFLDSGELQGHDYDLNVRFAPEEWDDCERDVIVFRSSHPSYLPWYPEVDELKRLRDALGLLQRFCAVDFKQFSEALYPDHEEGIVELPTYFLPEGGSSEDASQWEVRLEVQPPIDSPTELAVPDDKEFLATLSAVSVEKGSSWELGAVYGPEPILLEGRLVFTCVAMLVNSESGILLGREQGSAADCRVTLLRGLVSKVARESGSLPETLLISSQTSQAAMEGLSELGVQVQESHEKKSAIHAAVRSLFETVNS